MRLVLVDSVTQREVDMHLHRGMDNNDLSTPLSRFENLFVPGRTTLELQVEDGHQTRDLLDVEVDNSNTANAKSAKDETEEEDNLNQRRGIAENLTAQDVEVKNEKHLLQLEVDKGRASAAHREAL